jgi:hypothetical protein
VDIRQLVSRLRDLLNARGGIANVNFLNCGHYGR